MQYSIKQYSGNTIVVRLYYILHILTETCTVHIIHWPGLDFCWDDLPDSSPAASSRELQGVCCWLASWCSECGVDRHRRNWHHAWTRPVHWQEVLTAGSQVQAVAAASVDCHMKSLSCLTATACSIPRWSNLNIFYIGKLISPSFDPGLLSLDVWTSCVQAWCLFHVLCSLPSALTVSLKHSNNSTVSLVKMSKREFIYNVTASSVSSELKDKHIHVYSTMKLTQKNYRISNKHVHKQL